MSGENWRGESLGCVVLREGKLLGFFFVGSYDTCCVIVLIR